MDCDKVADSCEKKKSQHIDLIQICCFKGPNGVAVVYSPQEAQPQQPASLVALQAISS